MDTTRPFCGCGDSIEPETGARCGTCAALREDELASLRDMIDLGIVESQHKDLCNLREELRTLRDENAKLRAALGKEK